MDLSLVLVAPKYAGNVGSCARVAANFGVSSFYAVAPQCDVGDELARLFATGPSRQALDKIRVVASLKEALADCNVAVAVARRTGEMSPAPLAFRDLPAFLNEKSRGGRAALVLGREDNCLTSDEARLCSHQVAIPTDPFMPTMNLSHAAAVVLSRVYAEFHDVAPRPAGPRDETASLGEFEGMIAHFREAMLDARIDEGGNPDKLLNRLRRPLQRAQPSVLEVAAFRALLAKMQVALGTRERREHNSVHKNGSSGICVDKK